MLKTSINSSTIKYRFKYKLNKDNSELLDNYLSINVITKTLIILTLLCKNKKKTNEFSFHIIKVNQKSKRFYLIPIL